MLGGSVFGADSRLADAVQRGDKVAVRSLVADRANINMPQIDGTTALQRRAHGDLFADVLVGGVRRQSGEPLRLTPIQLAAQSLRR
jgi:hypothetical protein